MNNLIIKNASQVVTCSGFKGKRGKEMSDHTVLDASGKTLLPGFVDILILILFLEDIVRKNFPGD